MTDKTTTRADFEQPGLTLDGLLKAIADLEARLPKMEYWTSEYLPKLLANGEPAMYKVPLLDFDDFDALLMGGLPKPTGTVVYMFHPDNLAYFQDKARGHVRLIERKRAQGQEP